MAYIESEGFLIHAYADPKRDRVHLIGRLVDGRSFAASQPVPEPCVCIYKTDSLRAEDELSGLQRPIRLVETAFRAFDGAGCVKLVAQIKKDLEPGIALLRRNGIQVFGADEKGAQAFLTRNGIRAGICIKGEYRTGSNVDIVFPEATITSVNTARAPLSIVSFDIETQEPAGVIRAVGLSMMQTQSAETPAFSGTKASESFQEQTERKRCLIFSGSWNSPEIPDPEIIVVADEESLLRRVVDEIRDLDPDIITGWNIIDFDFPRLAAAFSRHHLPFSLGRSVEAGIYFPAEKVSVENNDSSDTFVKRSASVFLPGRQVLDGLRLVRTGYNSFDSYTLDAVAHEVLGRGKTVTSSDIDKLAELDRMYADEPLLFCRYCLTDADLVLDILVKRELIKHTIERAALTGAGIDKAWTSVASFERVYAAGLYSRGFLEPVAEPGRQVSGAAGGTVLDPVAGLFDNVAVFDFRSLYPSIIRTFNIDPLSYEQARWQTEHEDLNGLIKAPNGATFIRKPGILPGLIAEYFTERLAAIARGDDASAFVYKILMNSFYGVLGTPKCRYARTELAGAITSFGKMCLHYARDFFKNRGYRVLYGDTDSVFVELDMRQTSISSLCTEMAADLNSSLAEFIGATYKCESFIAIRYEKLYTRFFIPRLRSPGNRSLSHEPDNSVENLDAPDAERGRAKGYAGLLVGEDGSSLVEIKGMEAARSDYTPLARRFQRELLGHLFRERDNHAAEEYIRDQIVRLYRGELDAELVFRKKLRREPESYTSSTPPHIKVARALGWKHRRGTVEYVITVNGPEAVSLKHSPVDYSWYAVTQILPSARSVGYAAGFDADTIITTLHADGQLEFEWR